MESEEFKAMQAKALAQLMSGQSLTGKDGAFAPLLKQFLETALEAEMNGHLDADERSKGNKRNGKGRKTLKTAAGEITIVTPQDRNSSLQRCYYRLRHAGHHTRYIGARFDRSAAGQHYFQHHGC